MEQPANACATAGDLAGALAGAVDDELLSAAYRLLDSFLDIGPDENDLVHYRDGAVATERFLRHQPHPSEIPLETCSLVRRLERWTRRARDRVRHASPTQERGDEERRAELEASGWTEAACDRVLLGCAAVLDEPTLVERVRASYSGPDESARWDAWVMAPRIGLDLWETGFRQLTTEGTRHGLLQQLMEGASEARRARVIAWAEDHLPHRVDSEDPALAQRGPGRERSVVDDLISLVQPMRDGELFSRPLVLALLRSPHPGRALFALRSHPRERWGESVVAEVERLTTSPKERLADAARETLGLERSRRVAVRPEDAGL